MTPFVKSLVSNGIGLLGNVLASKGEEYVEKKLGIKLPDTSQPATVEQLEESRAIEFDNESVLIESAKTSEETQLTLSAQNMQVVALQQEDKVAKRFVYYTAWGILLFTFGYIGVISVITIPKDNLRFVDTTLGFLLGTAVSTIVQFFYGSSKGSQNKDNTINELIRGVK